MNNLLKGTQPRFPHVVLYCLTCRARLGLLALEDQTRDGRIVCTRCRLSEGGRLVETRLLRWNGWRDIVALAAICGLAWAILYFL